MTGQEQPNLEILWSTNEGPRPTHVGPSSIDEGQKSTAEGPWSTDEGPSSTNEGPGPLVRVCSLLLSVPLNQYPGKVFFLIGPASTYSLRLLPFS